jgi:hypothetical protein
VHEGGWTLTLSADHTITLRRPDGTLHFDGSTVDVAPTGVAPGDTSEHPADDERRLELLDELDQTPVEVAELAVHARARVRVLGPPARAPAA